jgi:hypothetical protein
MNINAITGLISWAPTTAQVGVHPVTVKVTDQGNLSATQSFNVTVAVPVEALAVTVAQFRTGKGELRVDGTSTLVNGNSISVFRGNAATGTPIGTAPVDPLTGAFTLRTTTALAGVTQITIRSAFGKVQTVALTVRN